MEVTTEQILKYTASYELNKLVKVELCGLTITENPNTFNVDVNHTWAYNYMPMSDYLQDVRNKCKEFYKDSEVMRFVVDNIKKILNTIYQIESSDEFKHKKPIPFDFVMYTIRQIEKHDLVSTSDMEIIKEFISNPTNATEEILNIIDYIKDSLGWNTQIVKRFNMSEPKQATCLMLNTIRNYITQCSRELSEYTEIIDEDEWVVYVRNDHIIRVHKYDRDIAIYTKTYNPLPISLKYFNSYQYNQLQLGYKTLQSYGKSLPDSLIDKRPQIDFLIRRFKYLVHVYNNNIGTKYTTKTKIEDAISDGRILIINLRGSNLSKDVLKSEVDKLFAYNSKSVYDADFIAFRFDNGFGHSYFIIKNRFGSKDVIMTKAEVMSLLTENY